MRRVIFRSARRAAVPAVPPGFGGEQDAAPDTNATRRDPVTQSLLTVLAVLGFAAPVLLYLWLMHDYAINTIWADQWNDVQVLGDSFSGHLTLSDLWALHYENRFLFPNLLMVLFGHTTHLNTLFEEYTGAILLFLSTGLIIFAHRCRTHGLPLLWYCPVAVIMLSIVQYQNTLWGFQICWYLVLFALAVTLVVLDRPVLTWWLLVLAMVASVVASYSLLQGLLVWPVGLLVLYLRRRPAAYCLAWIGIAILTTAVYFYNYTAPAGANGYSLRHLGPSLEFFLVMIGDVVGLDVTGTNTTGLAVILLGLAITVISVWVLVAYCRRPNMAGGSAIGAALIFFGLLFAALVTGGRVLLGLIGASSSRYRTFDLLIVAGLYLVALDGYDLRRRTETAQNVEVPESVTDARPDSVPRHRQRAPRNRRERTGSVLLAAFVTVLVSVVVGIGVPQGLAGANSFHTAQVRAARVTVNIGSYPNAFVSFVTGVLSARFLRQMAQVAMTHRLSLFATSEAAHYRAEGLIAVPSNPVTVMALPANGSRLSGSRWLSAFATDHFFDVTKVDFEVTGQGLRNQVVSQGQTSSYGWLGLWRTTAVPNGQYTLVSVAFAASGRTAQSPGIEVTVENR